MEALVELLFEILGGMLWAALEGILVTVVELVVDTVQWIWRVLRGRRGTAAVPATTLDPRAASAVSAHAVPDAGTATVRRGDDYGRIVLGLTVNIVLGVVTGCLSVLVMPDHMIASPTMRVVMVPVSAILCALAVPRMSTALGRTAESSIAIARPRNAFALALAFSLARLFGAG